MRRVYLVTGVTGFLGKVVLSELLRRRDELGLDKVYVLVRARRHQSGSSRFWTTVAASPCFAQQQGALRALIEVVDGELTHQGCGLTAAQRARVLGQTTHIIHCAASVDFDRPLEEAAAANITSARAVLQLAQACHNQVHLVATSTAYVHPHRPGVIPEALVELPRSAQEIYGDILRGKSQAALLAETCHANTYTYTKCIAEHLLVQERGTLALSIVRPSIISASLARPVRGWIDSRAAFAGFVCTIGSGLLRVIDGDPDARLDLVPVDVVAATLIDQSYQTPVANTVPIVHAVAGAERCANVGKTCRQIESFFVKHPVGRRPRRVHLKPRDRAFGARLALAHELPLGAYTASRALMGDAKGKKRARRIAETLRTINRVFPYFTHHTFAFAQARPHPEMATFRPEAYVELVCQGARTHLMQRSVRQRTLHADAAVSAQAWHPRTPLPLTLLGGGVRKLFGQVTYDELSLQQLLDKLPKDADVIIAPNHPSRIDGLLVAALVHARPDLGFLPLRELDGSSLVRDAQHRTTGLRARLKDRARQIMSGAGQGTPRSTLMFLEEQAGIGRRMGPIDRDVLRLLARGSRPKVLVPLTLSYERLPEEVLQLRGPSPVGPSALNGPRLVRWLLRVWRGEVRLGQVHISAAEPLLLGAQSSVDDVALSLLERWQRHQVAYRPALRAFIARHPQTQLDVDGLERLLEARGVRVLAGGQAANRERGLIQPALERSWRHSWAYAFWPELTARWPDCAALAYAAGPFAADAPAQPTSEEPCAHRALLACLAQAISADFVAAVQGMGRLVVPKALVSRSALRAQLGAEVHVADAAWLDAAMGLAIQQGFFEAVGDTVLKRRGSRQALRELLSSCALGPDATQPPLSTEQTAAPRARALPRRSRAAKAPSVTQPPLAK